MEPDFKPRKLTPLQRKMVETIGQLEKSDYK